MQILVILLHSLPIHFSVNSQGRVTVQIKWWPKFLCYFLSLLGPSWEHLGASWGHLGSHLEPS